MKKHPIETYEHYVIYIVSGVTPAHFIAEKADPSKGCTLTADNLEKLREAIDNKLDYALRVKINTWQGPVHNTVFQNLKVQIKFGNSRHDGLAVVVSGNYNIDDLIDFVGNHWVRISKKYKKRHKKLNLSKFYKKYNIDPRQR